MGGATCTARQLDLRSVRVGGDLACRTGKAYCARARHGGSPCAPGAVPCFRLQPQELLSILPPHSRIPLVREPLGPGSPPPPAITHPTIRRPGSVKITASCVQRPVGPVTLAARLLPGPQRPAGTNRASPSCILHARSRPPLTPLPLADHARAEFGLRISDFGFPSHLGLRDLGFLSSCFSDVFRPLPVSVQSLALTRPLLPSGGPKAVPSEDYSRLPP